MPLILAFLFIRYLISSRAGTVLLILFFGGYGMFEVLLDPIHLVTSIVFYLVIVLLLMKRFRTLTKRHRRGQGD